MKIGLLPRAGVARKEKDMLDKIVKCHICRKPYKVYSLLAVDQSACPDCREAAGRAAERPSTIEEDMRRQRYFGHHRWGG